jgi:hypothetical protein
VPAVHGLILSKGVHTFFGDFSLVLTEKTEGAPRLLVCGGCGGGGATLPIPSTLSTCNLRLVVSVYRTR